MLHAKAIDKLHEFCPTISVGILSADLLDLGSELKRLESTALKLLHFDIMDGCYVPFMTAGPRMVKALRTHLLKDVHLMVQDPVDKIGDYVMAGADIVTVHIDACNDMVEILRGIKKMKNANDPERGIIRGVVLNPDNPVESVEPLLKDLELVVLLAVNPKFKEMPFDDTIGKRFREVKNLVSSSGRDIFLCIDGGIKMDNFSEFAQLGADILVSGSAVFKENTPEENIQFMMKTIKAPFG